MKRITCIAVEVKGNRIDIDSIKDIEGNNLKVRKALFSEMRMDGLNDHQANKAKDVLLNESIRLRQSGHYGEALEMEAIANNIRSCFVDDGW